MIFAVTDEQQQLAETLRRLLSEVNEFEARRRRLRADPPDRLALWPHLAEMGVLGAVFDEAHGGFGGDARGLAVIMAALGESLAVEPFLTCSIVAGHLLQKSSAPFALPLIEAMIAGTGICVPAHDAGADPYAAPLLAAGPGRSSVSGRVRCVRNADVAHGFLLTVRSADSIGIHYVKRDASGLSVEPYRLMDGAGAADLVLDGLEVTKQTELVFDAPADAVLREALDRGLLGQAAEAAGIVRELNRATFSYLGVRKQFGAVLGSFQALQHRAADMHIASEEIAASVESAITAFDDPESTPLLRARTAAAAKITADTQGRRVGHESVQMHGGMGVSDELNVCHYARRLATQRAELGAADLHRLRYASLS